LIDNKISSEINEKGNRATTFELEHEYV
jgi:hypothetical protein